MTLSGYRYNEVDFHACQLVCGIMPNILRNGAGWSQYWTDVDDWFKQSYPDRWGEVVKGVQGYKGNTQQCYREQYYRWIRKYRVEQMPRRLRGLYN